ncbi:MAG: hypothetical protein AVDCRST_MAG56-3561, partial [uncultured Cytophagales bacterium]
AQKAAWPFPPGLPVRRRPPERRKPRRAGTAPGAPQPI